MVHNRWNPPGKHPSPFMLSWGCCQALGLCGQFHFCVKTLTQLPRPMHKPVTHRQTTKSRIWHQQKWTNSSRVDTFFIHAKRTEIEAWGSWQSLKKQEIFLWLLTFLKIAASNPCLTNPVQSIFYKSSPVQSSFYKSIPCFTICPNAELSNGDTNLDHPYHKGLEVLHNDLVTSADTRFSYQ